MKLTKIQVAFAEDIEEHRKRIDVAIEQTKNYELCIKAINGRDLILQLLNKPKKQPAIILMDMQMPSCDGLLATIICKWLFPKIKIIGLSAHTDGIVVGEFLAEGGDGFLSKLMLSSALAYGVYKDENIFENALTQLLNQSNSFIDIMLDDTGENYKNRLSTHQIISKNCNYLKEEEIKFLQLNAAGFDRKEIAELMDISIATLKAIISKLYKKLKVKNHTDLISITINLGIAKFVRIYQPIAPLIFD